MKLTREEKQRVHQEINARLNAHSRFAPTSEADADTITEPIIHVQKSHRSLDILIISASLAVGIFAFLFINHLRDPLSRAHELATLPGNDQWQPLSPKVFADSAYVSISNHDTFSYENTIIELHTQSTFAQTYRLAIGTLHTNATQRYKISDFVSGLGVHFNPGSKDRLSIRVICDTHKGAQTGTWTNG